MKEILIFILDTLLQRLKGTKPAEVVEDPPDKEVEDLSNLPTAQFAITQDLDGWDLEFELTSVVKIAPSSPTQMLVKIDSVVMKGKDETATNYIRQSTANDLHNLMTGLAESVAMHLIKSEAGAVVVSEDNQNKMLN